MKDEVTTLEEMLDQIDAAASDQERVSLATIMEATGARSFGPLLLLIGVVLVSPLSGIPGMPTAMGFLVFLISIQLLYRRRCCWVPSWLLRRSVPGPRLIAAMKWLKRPARALDRWFRPRLLPLVHGTGTYLVAGLCALLAATMPLMELLPFVASLAGAALATLGLALVSRDGLLALTAFVITGAGIVMLARHML